MTKREYLEQLSGIKRQKATIDLQISEIMQDAQRVTGTMDNVRVSGSKAEHKMDSIICGIERDVDWLRRRRRALEAEEAEIMGVIEQLENPSEKQMLIYRYALALKWDDIAAKSGYSRSQAIRIASSGINHLRMPGRPQKDGTPWNTKVC